MAQEIADSKLIDTWSSSGLIVKPDISKIIEGWQLGEQPPHEYMNWLQNTFGSKLNHILKNGVASWNNTTQYLAGATVQHNGNVWLCKTTNTNSEPTDANANWKRIITVESLTTVLGGYVALTGNQTIAGVKTFSSTISGSISGNSATATKLATARTINGVPFDGTANIDALPARLASIAQFITDWDLAIENGWYMGDNALNAPNAEWNLGIVEAYGFHYVTQTVHSFTMDSSSNSAVWRRQRDYGIWGGWYRLQLTQEEQDARYVKLTGDQTIAGVKTFSSSPIVPTPTTGAQVANKDYVDNSAIGVGQTWVDVTASRAVATTYTNTTGRTIHVLISVNVDNNTTFEVSGLSVFVRDGVGALSTLSVLIPSGGTYRLNAYTTSDNFKWLELR